MLIDLNLKGKYIVFVGGGSEGYRKASDFLEAGAKILIISKDFSADIIKLHEQGKICIKKLKIKNSENFVNSLIPKPELFVAVTDDHELNSQLIDQARKIGCLVYAPENPAISDFVLPALARVEDIRIAISTSGKSPAMARVLRKRIEELIEPDDLLQVRLQAQLREKLKNKVQDQSARRKILYEVLENKEIKDALREGNFEIAITKAYNIIEGYS